MSYIRVPLETLFPAALKDGVLGLVTGTFETDYRFTAGTSEGRQTTLLEYRTLPGYAWLRLGPVKALHRDYVSRWTADKDGKTIYEDMDVGVGHAPEPDPEGARTTKTIDEDTKYTIRYDIAETFGDDAGYATINVLLEIPESDLSEPVQPGLLVIGGQVFEVLPAGKSIEEILGANKPA